MKNTYIVISRDGHSHTLEGKTELDKWMRDGSIEEGDTVYTVKEEFKVTKKLVLTKEVPNGN